MVWRDFRYILHLISFGSPISHLNWPYYSTRITLSLSKSPIPNNWHILISNPIHYKKNCYPYSSLTLWRSTVLSFMFFTFNYDTVHTYLHGICTPCTFTSLCIPPSINQGDPSHPLQPGWRFTSPISIRKTTKSKRIKYANRPTLLLLNPIYIKMFQMHLLLQKIFCSLFSDSKSLWESDCWIPQTLILHCIFGGNFFKFGLDVKNGMQITQLEAEIWKFINLWLINN